MKFMQKFKNIFLLFLIFFLSQNFIFHSVFSMEIDNLSDLKEKLQNQDWRQTYKKFYKIALIRKENRTPNQILFLQACAELVYDDGDTLLHKVAKFVDSKNIDRKKFVIFHLQDNGAQVADRDNYGNNIIHNHVIRHTPSKKRKPFYTLKEEKQYKCRKKLNEKKVFSPLKRVGDLNEKDINAQNDMLATPLHLAMSTASENTAIVYNLLKNGANPKIPDINGRTALHRLIANKNLSLDIKLLNLKVLLEGYPQEKRAQLAKIQDNKGNRAIDFAKFYHGQGSEIFQLIKQMDARLKPKKIKWFF